MQVRRIALELAISAGLLVSGCSGSNPTMSKPRSTIDLQGHRGARGLLPENSIPAFRRALELGVNTLEMDAVISADNQVIVSHEPWFSASICRTPDDHDIREGDEQSHNIYRMSYEEIAQYDCGSRGNARFPEQEPEPVSKPLLSAVIKMAESYAADLGRPAPLYNIEIKSTASRDNTFHPTPDRFAKLLYDLLDEHGIVDRTTIQSFDVRALRAARALDPNVRLALLVDNRRGYARNVESLGFLPDIYSPAYRLVNRRLIERAHAEDVEVLPWTVNDPRVMRRLLEMGVDGLITDYPDLGREVVDAFARHEQ